MQQDKRERLPERHEKKYYINRGDMIALGHKLGKILKPDPHANDDGEYFIRSLYFDDAYDSAYYDKLDGVMGRDKYRIRIYNLSDKVIFLERKRKVGDLIQKSSCRLSRELAEQLIAGNALPLLKSGNPLLLDMYREMRTKLLRPKVLVDYTRETFVHPVENVRITFDKRLKTCPGSIDLFSRSLLTFSPLDDGREILEVKYDHYLPDYIASILENTPAENTAISKYVLCRRFDGTL